MTSDRTQSLDVEQAVRDRYSKAAKCKEEDLCIPTRYSEEYLKAIPEEILKRDYGCGDPTVHLRKGDTVLDLGSGTGKACFIASQVVGPEGQVLGIDMNDDMLSLARKHQPEVSRRIGFANTEFRKGMIQDLSLDVELTEAELKKKPIRSQADWLAFEEFKKSLRQEQCLVPDGTIDVVISNCVLNLVRGEDKGRLFSEIYRVLKRGGRIAISDIVSDEQVPERLQSDPELWSGCISGALQESEFLKALESVGFYGISIASRQEQPWRTVEGIEFRSMTVVAYKGKEGPCLERGQAVIYKGPWKEVRDDDGHRFPRGERVAVCDKTLQILSKTPYARDIIPVLPYKEIPLSAAEPFLCENKIRLRSPRETKGIDYRVTTEEVGPACNDPSGGSCC